jgi:hypothetical protein
MSCARLSLLTNVTRDPAETVMARGEAPLDVMVIVAPPGEGVGVGELGLLSSSPHATAASAITSAADRHERPSIRRTSSKY